MGIPTGSNRENRNDLSGNCSGSRRDFVRRSLKELPTGFAMSAGGLGRAERLRWDRPDVLVEEGAELRRSSGSAGRVR